MRKPVSLLVGVAAASLTQAAFPASERDSGWEARSQGNHCELSSSAQAAGDSIEVRFRWDNDQPLALMVSARQMQGGPVVIESLTTSDRWTITEIDPDRLLTADAADKLLGNIAKGYPLALTNLREGAQARAFTTGIDVDQRAVKMFDACKDELSRHPMKPETWPEYGVFGAWYRDEACVFYRNRRDAGVSTLLSAFRDRGELRFARIVSDHGPRHTRNFLVDGTELFGGRGESMSEVIFPLTLEQVDELQDSWLSGKSRNIATAEEAEALQKFEIGGPFARVHAAMFEACRESLRTAVSATVRPEIFELREISDEPRPGFKKVQLHELADQSRLYFMAAKPVVDARTVESVSTTHCRPDVDEPAIHGVHVVFRQEEWPRVLAATIALLDRKLGVFVRGKLMIAGNVREPFTRAMQVCGATGTAEQARRLAREITSGE